LSKCILLALHTCISQACISFLYLYCHCKNNRNQLLF
jgi:hypothetical protein